MEEHGQSLSKAKRYPHCKLNYLGELHVELDRNV